MKLHIELKTCLQTFYKQEPTQNGTLHLCLTVEEPRQSHTCSPCIPKKPKPQHRESTALETPAGSSLCSLKTGIGCDGSMKCGFPGFWKPGNEVLARSRAGPGCCEQGRNRRKAEIGLEEGCTVGEKASAENSIKKGKSSKKKKNWEEDGAKRDTASSNCVGVLEFLYNHPPW